MFKNSKIYGKFYSPEQVLSYGRPWIFCVGSRSIGKSTGWAIHILSDYLKNSHKFIYCRRTEHELQRTCKDFGKDAFNILKDAGYNIFDFKYENRQYFVKRGELDDWEQCGTIIPISQQQKYKSANFSEYYWIYYDEFIAFEQSDYIGSKDNALAEYDACISLYQSIDRGIGKAYRNETHFIFTGNNETYFNPLYVALGIVKYIRSDSHFIAPRGELWIVEQIESVPATEELEQSYAFKLSNAKNKNYAFKNTNDDNMLFIGRITEPMRGICNISFNKHKMGIYSVNKTALIYVSEKATQLREYALNFDDLSLESYMLSLQYRGFSELETIYKALLEGRVRFENASCKFDITNYFKLTR